MSHTAEDVNLVLSLINKLLNPKMKKFIRISMPNVQELLSSKFLDSGTGSLKLKKKKHKKKNTKKRKKSTKKKGGSPFSLFGPKLSKTVDDVGKKIDAGEPLTKHDATILCRRIDEVAAQTLISLIMSNEEIPGAKDVIKIYNRFLESQKKALAIVEKKSKEDKALVKAELEELEQSKMDKRVKDLALTICEEQRVQLGAVRKMVATKTKNVEDAARRNNIIKTGAFYYFLVLGMITMFCFCQFMYNMDSAMAHAQEWLSSFKYVCTSSPTFFERVAGAAGEVRDCKEGLGTPIFGDLVNAIADMITHVALTGAAGVKQGRIIVFVVAIIHFTAGPMMAGFGGYYAAMSFVREDDKEEMAALEQAVKTSNEMQKSLAQARAEAKVTVKQLADFVGTQSHEPMTTPTIIEMKSSGSKKSRGLAPLEDARIEEMSDPIPEEGALRKSNRKTRAKRSRARGTRAKRSRSPRRPRRTRRPSRSRY